MTFSVSMQHYTFAVNAFVELVVYFQKENIYTLDSKGELLITIMSSLAQYYVEGSHDAVIEPAGNILAPRSGIPTASISGRYGSATPSSRARANAPRPICTSSG